MHAIWKGYISFGLVHIPVSLYSGSRERPFSFHLYHKKDLSRIRYARICEKDGKEIPWEDVVKGYEPRKGKVIVLNEKELQKIQTKRKLKQLKYNLFPKKMRSIPSSSKIPIF